MNTAVARLNWQGQVVDGTFPLLQWLGGFEQSPVYRTQLPGQQAQAAVIKLIPADSKSAERQVARWQRAAALTHPHLLRLFHGGQCQINNTPLLYVVIEYAEEDLSQVLPARALSPVEARATLLPLVDALAFLHEKGFVHTRIKPSNIMAVGDQVKLSSDSIRAVTEAGDQTFVPSVFDAPEAVAGGMSSAADIWSVGITLVRCLSQRPDIREGSREIEPGEAEKIPEPFRHIARECLRRDPKARCTLADIRNWLRSAAGSPAVIQQSKEPPPRSRFAPVLVAAAIFVLLLFAMRWATHGRHDNPAQTGQQQPANGIVSTQPSAPRSAPSAGAVVERVMPDVSPSARNTIQGKIKVGVRVTVNPAGEVTGATLASPGPSKYFANKALEASRRWKFTPAEVDGHPVSSQWTLRFQFGRAGTEVVPTELQAGTR